MNLMNMKEPEPPRQVICGEFVVDSAQWEDSKQKKLGMEMYLTYTDKFLGPDVLIALIQIIKCMKGRSLGNLNERYFGGVGNINYDLITDNHWFVDAQGDTRKCPGFGMEFKSGNNTWTRWLSAEGGDYNVTSLKGGVAGTKGLKSAYLRDNPTRDVANNMAFHHQFEVAAVCICPGNKDPHGNVRGAITWGYQVDERGNWFEDDVVATNRPSVDWVAAANKWNLAKGIPCAIPGKAATWSK